MINFQLFKKKNLLFTILFSVAFLERTVFDLGPNIELVTLAMLLSASYYGTNKSFLLTFIIMFTTDIVLGNTKIFIFTWTGFLIPSLVSSQIFSKIKVKGIKKVGQALFIGAGANFFFFIWTNFGVWLLDYWGMYPKTFQGLVMSYINALPFWKLQLTSTIAFVTTGFLLIEAIQALNTHFKSSTLHICEPEGV